MHLKRAFTYVELSIVMLIVSLLMIIAVPNFIEAKLRALVVQSKADMHVLQLGINTYRLEHRALPRNTTPGQPNGWDLMALTTPVAYLTHLRSDAMSVEAAHRVPRGQRPVEPVPYRYLNGMQLDPKDGLTIVEGRPMGFDGLLAGLLVGYGPDSVTYSRRDLLQSGADGRVSMDAYDPTNGSTSHGEMYVRLP